MENRKVTKSKGKKRHSSYILLYFALILVAVAALIVLSLTVFFPIKSVKVEGSSRYSLEQIIDVAKIPMGKNVFTADLSVSKENILENLPYISEVRFDRCFPSTVKITVTKANAFAQIEQGAKCYIIDKNFKCLEECDAIVPDVPVIRGAKLETIKVGKSANIIGENKDACHRAVRDILISASNNKLKLTVVNVENLQNLWATYDNKIVLLFGSTANITKKFDYAVATINAREGMDEQGTLNLSRVPNSKNQVSFLPGALSNEQVAAQKAVKKKK